MRLDDFDAARLWDMLEYAREIVSSLGSLKFEQYLRDKNLRLATERRIEIIGEAARNVSPEFKADHSSVPWKKIVAMRHILAHEYGEVKHEVVFRIATIHIPELISLLEPILPGQHEEDDQDR